VKLKKNENILVIDNYDSFTLQTPVHYLRRFKLVVTVRRNDEFDIEEVENTIKSHSPDPGFYLSPGFTESCYVKTGAAKVVLGVRLGQQAIEKYLAEAH
jgi:anthranilate/para-aminobenzoate synthase component II